MQKLNKQNAEKSDQQLTSGYLDLEAGVSSNNDQPVAPACNLADYLRKDSQVAVAEKHEVVEEVSEEELGEINRETVIIEKEPKLDVEDVVKEKAEEKLEVLGENTEKEASTVKKAADDNKEPTSTRYSLWLSPI